MGDHGNRIGMQQFSYTGCSEVAKGNSGILFSGRIEERMPLMAIRLPTNFAEKYPNEYANFLKNKFKLTRYNMLDKAVEISMSRISIPMDFDPRNSDFNLLK